MKDKVDLYAWLIGQTIKDVEYNEKLQVLALTLSNGEIAIINTQVIARAI